MGRISRDYLVKHIYSVVILVILMLELIRLKAKVLILERLLT